MAVSTKHEVWNRFQNYLFFSLCVINRLTTIIFAVSLESKISSDFCSQYGVNITILD